MAGNRQHFLPRFLQKGFLKADGRFWVHRKDGRTFSTTPLNIGLETDFYGKPGQGSLDETITDAETAQSNCLAAFRDISQDTPVAHDAIPELITSLSIRSRWLREEFRGKTELLIDKLANKLPQWIPKLAPVIKKNPQITMLIQLGVPERQIESLIQSFFVSSEFKAQFAAYITNERAKIKGMAQSAHIEALSKGLAPPIRIDECKKLDWSILVRSPGDFILADVGPVFKTGEDCYKALPEKGDTVLMVALPIAHTHVLLGQRERGNAPSSIEINSASAKCSYEFLISSENSDTTKNLQQQIGDWSEVISDQDAELIIEQCLADLFKSL